MKALCYRIGALLSFTFLTADLRAQQLFIFQQGRAGYAGMVDNHVLINKPSHNAGGEIMIEACGNGGEADSKHALLRFDLSALPLNSRIDSAWVALYLAQTRTPLRGDKTLGIYPLQRAWGAGLGDDTGGFDGRPAQNGEANWQYAQFNISNWALAGANGIPQDRTANPVASRTFSPATLAFDWHEWPVTALVQHWIAHPDSNFGFVLREINTSPQTGILDFIASEYPDSALRPVLFVKIGVLVQCIVRTVQETHSSNTIAVTAQILGDENQNTSASVAYRTTGEWSMEQALSRAGNQFRTTLTALEPGKTYDLRVTFNDPDGVEGANPFLLPGVRLPATAGLINFAHLDHLTEAIALDGDTMAFVHLYSNYPNYEWVGDADEGIAAVDDAARAAVVYLRHYAHTQDQHSLRQAKLLLHFLFYMQADDGGFYNFIWPDYSINRNGSTSNNDRFNWWAGRAVWAMGYALRVLAEKEVEANLQQQLAQRLDRAIAKASSYVTAANSFQIRYGFRVPASGWLLGDGTDFSAEMALGVAHYFQVTQNSNARMLLEKLCDGIAACQLGDAVQFPFGLFISSPNNIHLWHAWGGRQMMALALAGHILSRPDWISAAQNAADQFYLYLLTSDWLAEVNPSFEKYAQIQYGTASAVEGMMALYLATGNRQYAQWAGLLGSWWLGNNLAGRAMYDSTSGRCYDGLDRNGVNLNSGGESVAEGLLGLQAIFFESEALPFLFYREHNRHAYRIVEAEDYSAIVSGAPFISNSQTYGPARVSNGRYLELRSGDAVRYRLTISSLAALNDEYAIYVQFGWQAGDSNAVGVSIEVDGAAQFHAQGGAAATFLWVKPLQQKIKLPAGEHEIVLRYAGQDPQRTAIVDYLMLQPLVQRKTFIGPASETIILERRLPPATAVHDPGEVAVPPRGFNWQPIHPNPVASQTRLMYELPQAERVTVRVFNLLGQEIAVLQRGPQAAGRHEIIWDAGNVPAGVYVVVLETATVQLERKVVVIR